MTEETNAPARAPITWRERAAVLGGFAVTAMCTAVAAVAGSGMATVAALWLAATVWAFFASFALALRRGLRHRDRSAFGRHEMADSTELIDWSTSSGAWFDMTVAEEHERLMRGD